MQGKCHHINKVRSMRNLLYIILICSFILLPISEAVGDSLVPDTDLEGNYVLVQYSRDATLGDTVVFKVTSRDFSVYLSVDYQSKDDDLCSTTPCWVSIGTASKLDPNKSKSFYIESNILVEGFTSSLKSQFTGIEITFRILVKATSTTTSVLEELPFKIKISPSSARSGLAYTMIAFTGLTILIGSLYFYRKRRRR